MLDFHLARGALIAALALLAVRVAWAAPAPPSLADCNASSVSTVLRASAAIDARAHWIDRERIQWPGVQASAQFKLYHAANGAIRANPGARVAGADGSLVLSVDSRPVPEPLAERFRFVASGVHLRVAAADWPRLLSLHRQQVVLVRENDAGEVLDATAIQVAGALDELYAAAEHIGDLGATPQRKRTTFKLWAPTARRVALCIYPRGEGPARAMHALQRDALTGVWHASLPIDLSGHYYSYLVDVHARGTGLVRNRVTDPYSVSLTTDSQRSYVADLKAASLEPPGWRATPRPTRVAAPTDLVIYELHVRDFSANDPSVSAAHRGKYLAFTENASNGMQHLKTLADAGITDVHLLPVFDLASVPELGCTRPAVPDLTSAAPDSVAQQAAVMQGAATDCFNWGYDPWHYTAPEGSYATDAADGAVRIREFRAMVQALHAAGLRVGMDMVYNHTTAAGQHPKSVLDRIVPGYYHRLNEMGEVERSTCCDNTATEHRMMAKLMIDSAVVWARDHRIDGMRFDLMGHQPRAAMERLQRAVDAAAGRHIHLLGEGWNFGEVANGKRFVQASQLSLNGSGIGSFSDRARDAVRGGGAGDNGTDQIGRQGYVNGLHYDANEHAAGRTTYADLLRAADMVRVGLAATLREYSLRNHQGEQLRLERIAYGGGQPAGFASQPSEVVNYVENHDNQTLFDANVFKLPRATSREDRARVQTLASAIVAFSQGIAYFHAGQELLRSKSMDRNSFDSGDWFNRIDWSLTTNHFGSGLPPERDNGASWALMRPLLADAASIAPGAAEIRWAREAFLDLLRIRASTTLLRLRSADEVQRRLTFFNTGPDQIASVVVGHLDGAGYPGANFRELLYLVNVDKVARTLAIDALKGRPFELHPVHVAAAAADRRPVSEAVYRAETGTFAVPARTAVVYVLR